MNLKLLNQITGRAETKLGMMEQGDTLENRHSYPVGEAVKAARVPLDPRLATRSIAEPKCDR